MMRGLVMVVETGERRHYHLHESELQYALYQLCCPKDENSRNLDISPSLPPHFLTLHGRYAI